MDINAFVNKHIPGLRILPISTRDYIPGALLMARKLSYFGHLRDIFPGHDDESWEYSRSEASMIYGNLTGRRNMRGGGKVLGLFSLKASMNQEVQVQFEVRDIRGSILNISQIHLQPKINALRVSDRRGAWRKVNGRLVVLEAFYASQVTARFYRDSRLLAEADLRQAGGLDLGADLEYSWRDNNQMVISSNDQVPFGVRGFVV